MAEAFLAGLPEFEAALTKLIARQAAATRVATGKAAHLIEKKAKENLSRGSHRKGEPTGSNPGEPPELVTGTLRRSISVTGPEVVGPATYKAEVGPTAVYGRIQELGGVAGNYAILPPRPYLGPTIVASQAEFAALFREAWRVGQIL